MKSFDFSIIRTLRMKWGLTAEELAARANVTRATVVKIESGTGNPTIDTLGRLSRVFRMPVSELIRMAETSEFETGIVNSFQEGGISGNRIEFPDFEIYHLKAGAGVTTISRPGRHENTAEVCLVISGTVRVAVQEESHKLGPDTAIRFRALQEHRIDILSDAEFLLIHHHLP